MKHATLKRSCVLLALVLLLGALVACGGSDAPLHAELDFTAVDPSAVTETDAKTDYVKLTVADYGDIIIRLYPEVAPKTVDNFKALVAKGHYDGVIFHRVISSFVAQAGMRPDGSTGNGAKSIKGEFRANGYENNLKHIRGVVSMARTPISFDSASDQFYICHKSNDSTAKLNGQYAGFGYVVSGMDVVDAIATVATNADDRPFVDVVIEKACFVTVNP